MSRSSALFLVAAGLLAASIASRTTACPFCSAVSLTFSEEMANSDAVVIAKIVRRPPAPGPDDPVDAPAPLTGFEVVKVLKGEDLLGGKKEIDGIYFGQDPDDTQFLMMGIGKVDTQWSTPIALTPRSVEYLAKLPSLPPKGADRLAFFQEYFEDSDDLLARDSYDEFARAPYAEVKELKDRMHREKLLAWIDDPRIMTSHRRLYLTMLSVCGQPADIDHLEAMIKSDDREVKTALDALIACYLTLKGPDGLPLIEDLFLKNAQAEYTDTYSAIMALRFHGQESDTIPKPQLLAALRYMLDRPELADLVIPDLARWEDWSVMNRLAELFKNADEKSSWVRVPVINYLRVCPQPEAKALIEELAKVDPEAVERANSFFPLGTPGSETPVADVPPATKNGAEPTDEAAADSGTGDSGAGDPLTNAFSQDAQAPADPLPPAPVAEPEDAAAPAQPAANNDQAEQAAAPAVHESAPAPPAAAAQEAAPAAPAAEEKQSAAPVVKTSTKSRSAPSASPWALYIAPLGIAGLLFVAFQLLLRPNRSGTPA